MKRSLVIVLVAICTALLGAGLITAVALSPGWQTETWEAALQRHLAYLEAMRGEQWRVVASEQATVPSAFTPDLSLQTYGEATTLALDIVYGGATPTPTVLGLPDKTSSRRPIPYPPETVHCVWLRHEASETTALVFVNLHQDLYNAAWIVHSAGTAPVEAHILANLKALGCEMRAGGEARAND
jgi:hypothetical protein